MKIKSRKLILAVCLLLISATMLGTASFAWFSMNTEVSVDGIEVEAYSDALFLEIANENTNNAFDTTTTIGDDEKHTLRLATPIRITADTVVYNVALNSMAGNYYHGESTVYYTLGDTKNDTYSAENIIKVDNATLEAATFLAPLYSINFVRTDADEVADTTTTYFEKVADGYKVKAFDEGASVYGYYKASDEDELIAIGGSSYCTDVSELYYSYSSSTQTYTVVEDLTVGTSLNGYYTITATPVANKAAATGKVYVANGNDYVFIKDCGDEGVNLVTNDIYWGRTYSTALGQHQNTNTVSVIKSDLDSYRYAGTVYLRCAENTNDGTDLKIADVKVGGRVNDLSNALRVLFVATNGKGDVVFTTYSNRDGMAGFDGDLFDTILGDQNEVVTVDMYVYFDGTDVDAYTKADPADAGVLNGQSIEVKFTIAEHSYN